MAMALNSSVLIQNMVIPKFKDFGSFFIPYQIGTINFKREFCDLGDSVNLMPLPMCKKLDIGETKPINMSLQLEDRPFKFPIGVLENVPVRVKKYYVPIDFVIMDIDEDPKSRYF